MDTTPKNSAQDIKMSVSIVFPKRRKTPMTIHPGLLEKGGDDVAKKVASILALLKRNKSNRR